MKKRRQYSAGCGSRRGLLTYAGKMAAVFLSILTALAGMCIYAGAEEGYDEVAGSSSMGKMNENLAPYGMTPVSGNMIEDGEYVVGTECSSSFFHIEEAKLTVQGGQMTALLTMSSSSYLLVYPGTAEEAAAASYEDYIPSVEIDTWDTFTVPVEALDTELDLAAFSKKKKKWYPRKILFHAADIPADCLRFAYPDYDRIGEAMALYERENGPMQSASENAPAESAAGRDAPQESAAGRDAPQESAVGRDAPKESAAGRDAPQESAAGRDASQEAAEKGSSQNAAETGENTDPAGAPQAVRVDLPDGGYSIEVSLAGGSGRASVTTPTWMEVRGGSAYARLLWSSPYYDYMILGGEKYLNETTDGGNSSFTIPIPAMDAPVEIIADTTAMGDPVEIHYTLTFYEDTIGSRSRVPQEGAMRVLAGALVFIVVGGIVNSLVKKNRRK